MAEDKEELLQMLNAYGQDFMSSFDSSIFATKRKGSPEPGPSSWKKPKVDAPSSEDQKKDEEEWAGFGDLESEGSEEDDLESGADYAESAAVPAVVVFSESRGTVAPVQGTSKTQLKAFMSSKVSKITQELATTSRRLFKADEDADDELSNAQNDALLHKLVHTKILSGSLNSELELTPAQRRKALAGRVLEAAGQAKLGKGETSVRSKERNKAAKHVRDGLLAKQKERNHQKLEEAKHMGNYHPALKQLFEDDAEQKPKPKRERGLNMGVGKFSGGVLKLSRHEIASATGPSQRGPQRKSGRGKRR